MYHPVIKSRSAGIGALTAAQIAANNAAAVTAHLAVTKVVH